MKFLSKHPLKALLLLFLFISLFITQDSGAKNDDATCLEDCQKIRKINTKEFNNCISLAKKISDTVAAVKHKQNCRKRFPIPNCDTLKPCQTQIDKGVEKESAKESALEMGELNFTNQNNSNLKFKKGQTIEIQYQLKVNKKKGSQMWFDQDIIVYDAHNNEMLQDKQTFKRSGELVSSYEFKTSFIIPDNFNPGEYQLRVLLREKFLQWEGEKRVRFHVQ